MWIVGSIAAVVLMVTVGSVAYGVTRDLQTIARGSTVPDVPTATPDYFSYPTNAVTDTPSGPHIITGATIGGTQIAFELAFGSPAQMVGKTSWYQATTSDGTAVLVCFCSTDPGKDGRPRLALFQIKSANGQPLTTDQSLHAAQMFFPPDAHHVRDFTDPNIGVFHVYQSTDLALTFPASEFTDSGGGPNPPPGTFSVTCGAACSIGTGT